MRIQLRLPNIMVALTPLYPINCWYDREASFSYELSRWNPLEIEMVTYVVFQNLLGPRYITSLTLLHHTSKTLPLLVKCA